MEIDKQSTISIYEFFKKFPDEESARKYLEGKRWGDTRTCPHCGSIRSSVWRNGIGYYRCKDCRKVFCVKTGTIFMKTKIPLTKWLLAFYIVITARKGMSSMQLSKELGINYASAWLLGHKIRKTMEKGECDFLLKDVVEIDETYFGGKEKNKHSKKKLKAGRGATGKTPVFGIVERNGQLFAKVICDQKSETFSKIITENVKTGTTLNTDEATWYNGIENFGYERKVVNHSAKQFVDNMAYTNTIESAWALLKRGYYGI